MVRFFGANDQYTLNEAIDYLKLERSKQFNGAGIARKKSTRAMYEYAGHLLTAIIEDFEKTRDNGPTPLFILEKLGKAPKDEEILIHGLDEIQDSIAPGGKLYVSGDAPDGSEGFYAFVNWLADQQGPVVWIQEIVADNFGINQYVLDPDTIRRVVLASRADTVCVRTRQRDGTGTTVTHTFDRGKWLNLTEPRVSKVDGSALWKLALVQD